ncbi:MAG TPA: FN3 associated domain-containing protein [Ignavibacteriaceae bacterium]|nr:FN3 associated domain-containing protein [Ignavibacteriaceae bacterium]
MRFRVKSIVLSILFLITCSSAQVRIAADSVSPPVFSHKHGFYDNPFNLEITSDTSDEKICYTTDGSEPDPDNGTLYNSPIKIEKTAIIRAIAVNAENFKSKITTSTYLFLDDIINQPNNPEGYPEQWGKYFEISGTASADYEMDPEVTQDPRYAGLLKDALLQIPTISIVTNKDNLFSSNQDPEKGGIYIYTGSEGGTGDGWERPASVEFFKNNGQEDFQIDCGLRIHGGASRYPDKTPKHSFHLAFREEYGKPKLKFPLFGGNAVSSFNSIVLRANYGNTWLHRSSSERNHTQLIHDTWGKDTQLDMGNPAGHGIFVHLYLNGIYWGIYNPTEQIDDDFCVSYFGGNKEDYDIIKDYNEVFSGSITAWNNMMKLARAGLADNANYQRLQGKNPDGSINPQYESYLDIENFIDYMLINYYGSNWDWDHHNWIAVRNRVYPGKGFKFFSWDAEHICESVTASSLAVFNSNHPTEIFSQLIKNAEFRRLFADRVQMHCYNGGALTPEAGLARWMKRADEIDLAIIAESARWGDYRRDVHRYYPDGPFELYTKENWSDELAFMQNEFFPRRTAEFIKQLREADLFPSINAPQFLINGNESSQNNINPGDKLQINSWGGEAYYTIDGSDPLFNNQPSPGAFLYSVPIELTESIHLKARTFKGNEWSAINEKIFLIKEDINNLKLTEIHYHPALEDTIDDKNFEFIELKSTGSSPVLLSGYKFTEGISFTFPPGTVLNPKEFILLASDKSYFELRYKFSPFDEYIGSLDNSGERIVFENPAGDTVFSIKYNDKDPWPVSADGDGYSLVSTEKDPSGDQNDPAKWTSSYKINGSPGEDDINSNVVNVDKITSTLLKQFQLFQNYPNPFNPTTHFGFRIPDFGFVSLKIFDILGNRVATLVNEEKQPGSYELEFNGSKHPSGVYFYRLTAGKFSAVKKMLLIK